MRLFVALCLIASAASAQKPASDPGFAKLPGTTLRIADSLRIDVQAAKLEPPLTVFPGPKGGLIVYAQWRTVIAFDSLGRRLWSQGSENRDRRELADVTAFGWDNAGSWVSDAGFSQIAILDQYGNVTKSLELPSFVRPTFSNRKTFPAFESMRVLGRGPNGTMLVMPRGDHLSAGATTYDENSSYLMWVNEDGIIQKTIAKFPAAQQLAKTEKGENFRYNNPLNQYLFRVAPDGKHTVLVSVDTSDKKMDTVVVRGLNERGDTIFTQKFGYPSKSFTDTQIDSIGRNQWGNDTDYRERRTKLLGRRAPAVSALALDADKSVWLSLRGSATSRAVIGIDATGKYIGKFELPARRVVRAANLGRVWIGELRSDMRGDLVRYRLVK